RSLTGTPGFWAWRSFLAGMLALRVWIRRMGALHSRVLFWLLGVRKWIPPATLALVLGVMAVWLAILGVALLTMPSRAPPPGAPVNRPGRCRSGSENDEQMLMTDLACGRTINS